MVLFAIEMNRLCSLRSHLISGADSQSCASAESVDTDVDRHGYRNCSGYRADRCPSTGDSLLLCISNKPAVAPEESTHTHRHTNIMELKCKQDTLVNICTL